MNFGNLNNAIKRVDKVIKDLNALKEEIKFKIEELKETEKVSVREAIKGLELLTNNMIDLEDKTRYVEFMCQVMEHFFTSTAEEQR
uniref:CRISPR type III A-associated protein Csm2 n=1 Tax=Rhabditophanes sp. KR3021 TaxID=114890 RepID=A0AC35U1G8_9BILA